MWAAFACCVRLVPRVLLYNCDILLDNIYEAPLNFTGWKDNYHFIGITWRPASCLQRWRSGALALIVLQGSGLHIHPGASSEAATCSDLWGHEDTEGCSHHPGCEDTAIARTSLYQAQLLAEMLKGSSSLENLFSCTFIKGCTLFRILISWSAESISLWRTRPVLYYTQPSNFKTHSVILSIPCGGAADKLNT